MVYVKRKPLAYSKALMDRRAAGERVGLLVVGVHDWEAGQEMACRQNVLRVVVPQDAMPHEVDFSPCVALDCLICGRCAEPMFFATAIMLHAAGAASIWGEFDDGVWRLERDASKSNSKGFVAVEGPIQSGALALSVRAYREWALMTSRGVYGTKLFDAARVSLFDKAFGVLSEKAQAWVSGRSQKQVRAR